MALDCLNTLIGLDDSDCECFLTDRPETYNTSDSGYYLTEYLPVKQQILSNKDCGSGTVWDVLIKARSKAIRDLKNDLSVALSEIKTQPGAWRGTIGKVSANNVVQQLQTHQGVQFRTRHGKRSKDQQFVIKAIWAGFNTSDGVELTLSSNKPSYTSQVIDLTTVAGRFNRNELETPLTLDLYDIAESCVRYNFTYSLSGSMRALQNKVWCCSRPGWMDNLEVHGLSSSDFVDTKDYNGTYAMGLAFEGYFTCNKLDWICELDELNGSDMKVLIARAMQAAGTVNALNAMLQQNKVNTFTLLEGEAAYQTRSKMHKFYKDTLLKIALNVPSGWSSCWGCDKDMPEIGFLLT